jgi:hypothetical protein
MKSFNRILLLPLGIALIALPFLIVRFRPDHPGAEIGAKPSTVIPSGTIVESGRPPEPRHYRPKPATESVRQQADEVIRRHRGLRREEFEKSAELQELGGRFFAHLNTPAFQEELENAIEDLKSTKGIEHGSLNFELNDLDSPNARAWIEAALSEHPQRAQDYVMNLLEGAIFEFALDPNAETSSEGVTVKGTDPAPGSDADE